MRKDIVSFGSVQLSYEIRGIVDFALEVEGFGVKIFWENIGDPVNKGEKLPLWIKSEVKSVLDEDINWAYSPTKGLVSTRKFLANMVNENGGAFLNYEDIVFFNGLGDAISKVYSFLGKEVRVIGPNPAYPTHSSAEAAHCGYTPLTYRLDPENGWLVDIEDLRAKVKYNEMIVGILIINPDNPTGMVYPREILEEIVEIAKEYNLFLISDEIYSNLVYNDVKMVTLSEVIGDVPAIVMKGISKDFPWPGGRCGWIEFYNKDRDENFASFANSIVNAKMLEVCSTTLPQAAIPKIFSNPKFEEYLDFRREEIERKANYVYDLLKDVKGIIVNKTYGSFYTSIVFEKGVLNLNQFLKIDDLKLKRFIDEKLEKNMSLDKRFVYYLLASSGICVVPLSSFSSDFNGFRITLLEKDEERFKFIFSILKEKIIEYLSSN